MTVDLPGGSSLHHLSPHLMEFLGMLLVYLGCVQILATHPELQFWILSHLVKEKLMICHETIVNKTVQN